MFGLDALKAEIATKRKVLDDPAVAARPTKYMKRGDLERLKEEQERKAAEERREKQLDEEETARKARAAELSKASSSRASSSSLANGKSRSTSVDPAQISTSTAPQVDSSVADAVEAEKASPTSQLNTMSPEETIRRLRQRGQPIRLFAESDKDRRLRLRALELLDEKDHERQGGQNDFKKALEDVENTEREMHSKGLKGKKKGAVGGGEGESVLDLDLIKSDPDKLYPIIYHALKRILKEWGESMDDRPVEIKQSRQGKLAAATQVQSAEYLKPLFKQLRSRALPADMLARIAEIVHHVQKRQYQRANDSYLRLSIGNAPWPIGVTMVGIHERSAREKISADQVAHVLNDEVSRKYIQSLKRLITFSQTKYPPADISQLMG